MFANAAALALNHLLTQNSWALPRLARFAGKTVRVHLTPFNVAYTVLADGAVLGAGAEVTADATCYVAPTLLPRLLAKDETVYGEIRTEGDGTLLSEIFALSRQLQWDVAEDLSPFTGDILAERIVRTAQAQQAQFRQGAQNLAETAAEYVSEERPLIVKPAQLAAFVEQVDTLRDDVARLAQRISRLQNSR